MQKYAWLFKYLFFFEMFKNIKKMKYIVKLILKD